MNMSSLKSCDTLKSILTLVCGVNVVQVVHLF